MKLLQDVGVCIEVMKVEGKYEVKYTSTNSVKNLYIPKHLKIATIIHNHPMKIDWTSFYSNMDSSVREIYKELLNLKI